MKAFILAGGKGTRLYPYTTVFPKPLMPINEKPILEIVLMQLKKNGITDVILSTGYLEELIRAYFQGGEKWGLRIRYSKEEEPLGTAGPLCLVREQFDDTFIVMNGDVLADVSFRKLIALHKKNKSMASIVTTKRSDKVDYGVVTIDSSSRYTGWREKPVNEYLVSTGIYVLEPAALQYIPDNKYFTMPDLIEKLHAHRKNIYCHVHKGYWLDIGRPDDYENACADFAGKRL